MGKIVLIRLDSATWYGINPSIDELPNFSSLKKEGAAYSYEDMERIMQRPKDMGLLR